MDFTDRQMLQSMGRAHLGSPNESFLRMLDTWESGLDFVFRGGGNPSTIDVARLLGWMEGGNLNAMAAACRSAHVLTRGGYLSRDSLAGLSFTEAQKLVEREHFRLLQERAAERAMYPGLRPDGD